MVDDERDAVATLVVLLRREGYAAVAILDLAMPAMSGLTLAQEIRRILGDASPLLVALTGQSTREDDKTLGREAGFDHWFHKPCDAALLLKLLAGRRAARR